MHLKDKLASISSNNTVFEIDRMLNLAHVSINWFGQRIVTVGGYEGSVEINQLAKKYFFAHALILDGNPSLQERLDCHALWGRMQQLFTESEDALKRTWAFKYPLIESLCCVSSRYFMTIFKNPFEKKWSFAFTPQEFNHWWPETSPELVIKIRGYEERWMATPEMVETALDQVR